MIDDHDGNIIIMIELSRLVGLTQNSTPPLGQEKKYFSGSKETASRLGGGGRSFNQKQSFSRL